MDIVVPGKHYRITTAKGQKIDIIFCHSTTNEEGNKVFTDGITSEELLKVLIDRHGQFAREVDTVENINVWTHLRQAFSFLTLRLNNKWKHKKRKNDRQRNAV